MEFNVDMELDLEKVKNIFGFDEPVKIQYSKDTSTQYSKIW